MAPDVPAGQSPLALLLRDQRQRWQRGERILVESYLEQHPLLGDDAEGALDLIYQEIVLREERGEAPQAEEFLGRFPQFADQLAMQFEVDRALLDKPALRSARTRPRLAAPLPDRIVGYEILSELGRGGMGVVYQAWQTGLHRLVALKMILAGAHASPEHRARFRTEAEAVGRLQHANIVQIYETGTHDDQPFFSMEFVDGGSLAEYLDGTPLPAGPAGRLIAALARAIHFAHRAGIIHRDLKPANVLLDCRAIGADAAADSAGALTADQGLIARANPKISDFSLAKLLIGGPDSPTRSGDVLGTPGYMAPEQAGLRGIAVSPATDVYALGAILYQLLTGRPPFQAAGLMETLERICFEEPIPPRRLEPKVPRDLETICLKCLEKEPRRRYASAEELADDLDRFQAGQPLHARPVGLLERAWKWARRRPTAAALLIVTCLAAISLSAVGIASYVAVSQAAQREARQRADAEEGFQQALLTVDFLLAEATQGDLADWPHLEHVRKRLLEKARQLYQGLVEKRPLNPDARQGVGRALIRLADVQSLLGEHAEAERAYRQTIALLKEMGATYRSDRDLQHDVAMAWNNLGMLYDRMDRPADAEAALRQAAALRRETMEEEGAPPARRVEWAGTWFSLGKVLARQPGQRAAAERTFREALAVQETSTAAHPDELPFAHDQARTLQQLSLVLQTTDRAAALAAIQRAVALQGELAAKEPTRAVYRRDLADGYRQLGDLQAGPADPEAEAAYRRAVEVLIRLNADFPGVPAHRRDLARTLVELGRVLPAAKALEAETCFGQAVAIASQLVVEFVSVSDYHQTRSHSLFQRGLFLVEGGRCAEATPSLVQALAIQLKLANDFPALPGHADRYRAMLDQLLTMLRRQVEQAATRLGTGSVAIGSGSLLAVLAFAIPAEVRAREAQACLDGVSLYKNLLKPARP